MANNAINVIEPSFGSWFSNFDLELQVSSSWDDERAITIINPDGTGQNFTRQSDGSLTPYTSAYHRVPDKEASLVFIGTWPSNLGHLNQASTQWQLTDRYNNVWTLQTMLNPVTGKYDVGRPTQEKRPDGTTLTIAYGSDYGISTITDQNGKVMTFTWTPNTVYDGSGATVTFRGTISSIALPNGYKINYTYEDPRGVGGADADARLKQVDYVDASNVVQDTKSYLYENSLWPSLVTSIRDRSGTVRWKALYDTQGRATTSEGPGGEYVTTVGYADGFSTDTRTRTDALGRTTTYNFNGGTSNHYAQLTSVTTTATTNVPATTITDTYGTDYLLASHTDEEGRVTQYTRNSKGQPTTIVEAYGTSSARTTNLTWDTIYNLPDQIVTAGLTTNYTYDTQGRLLTVSQVDTTTQTVPYSTNGQTRTWTYTYGTTGGASGKLVSIDGPLSGTGDTQAFTYNTDGYLATYTDEVGKVTTITSWDWRGAPLTVVDPNSISTTFTYDIHGRPLTATVNPGGTQSQYGFTYDIVGNLTQITLPGGGYLTYSYDTANRLTGVGNDKGETITLTPNLFGEPTLLITKTSGGTITQQQSMVYDEIGRLIQSIGSASSTATNLAYDKVDNLKTVTDGRGKAYNNTFDKLDRVITQTNPQSQAVNYAYDAHDQPIDHKDGRNLETTFVTNGFGDTIGEVSPDRGTRTYWYDNAGHMTKLVDGDSEETDFTYDNAGRLLTKTFPTASWENMAFTYDSTASGNKGNGRLTSVAEQSGSTAFTYDAQGRITNDAKTIQSETYSVGYGYDANGKVTQITMPSGRIVTYTRDSEGLITAVTTKPTSTGAVSNIATSVTYQPFGPLKGLTYGNGLTLARTYNTNTWLTRIQVTGASTTTFDLGYQYYDDGSLGEIDDNAATGRTVYMALSDSGRLTYAAGPWGQETYTYDAAGNRTGDYLTVGSTTTTDNEITSGSSNRLVKTTDALSATKRTLTYRTGGDLYTDATTGGSTYAYLYSARKRLVEIKLNSVVAADYGYDFREQRVWRTLFGPLTSTTIHYVFDEQGHLLAEHDGSTGAVLREYIWVDDMPVAVIDSTGMSPVIYYIHTGHLNEPQVMTDASKAKVWDAFVSPFGSASVFTAASANIDMRLPGQWFQAEAAGAGLNQNNYRDYDPSLGRYIEADPTGLNGGQNPYAYVSGEPYDFTDPLGLTIKVGGTNDFGVYLKVQQALRTLKQDSEMNKIINQMQNSKEIYRIVINSKFEDDADTNKKLLYWDPNAWGEICKRAGKYQSPTTILAHELAHFDGAVFPMWTFDDYDDAEEKRVIMGAETRVAQMQHEPVRTNHHTPLVHR